MTLFQPFCATKLIERFENCFSTYTMCAVRVSKVAGKIDLMWLYLLEKFDDDVDICLGALTFLDASCLIERKIEEVSVGLVVKSE